MLRLTIKQAVAGGVNSGLATYSISPGLIGVPYDPRSSDHPTLYLQAWADAMSPGFTRGISSFTVDVRKADADAATHHFHAELNPRRLWRLPITLFPRHTRMGDGNAIAIPLDDATADAPLRVTVTATEHQGETRTITADYFKLSIDKS